MTDSTQSHQHQHQRHTAKSDQRFDASRRTITSTPNENNSLQEARKTNGEEKTDKNEKKDKVDDNEVDRNRLHPKDEIKILKHWGLLKKTVVISNVIDPLIEKGIITPEKWMTIKKSQKFDNDIVEDFLYLLLKSHPDAYEVFLKTLKSRGYSHVASQLEGLESPSSSGSSGKLI